MKKLLAMLVLVAVLGGSLALIRGVAVGAAARKPPTTPFRVGRLVGLNGHGKPEAIPDSGRHVALYVTDTCPYSAEELRAWGELLDSGQELNPPTVILSPRSNAGDVSWLPRALRSSWIHDASGDLARRLHVRAVPFTAVVEDGFVTAVTVGRHNREALIDLFVPSSPSQGGSR